MKDSRIGGAWRLILLALLPALVLAAPAVASSHREAPGIAKDPVADNTDVYFFRDPTNPTRLVMISNWIPLEEPAGGPNFSHFEETIRYEFNVDSDGDGLEDIVYRLEFTRNVRNGNTFLQNTGAVLQPTDATQNVYYTYKISKCLGPSPNQSSCTVLGNNLLEAPNNVGPKSFPNGYDTGSGIPNTLSYAVDDNTLVFAGPRADGFFVDLGMVFDLINFRPGTLPGNMGGGVNSLAGYNTHSIAISVPIQNLTANHTAPTDPTDPNAIVSMWSSTWRRQTTTLSASGAPPAGTGAWVQVSRLGNPLINEVIIPLGQKDKFNATQPVDDLANFGTYVLNPELAGNLHRSLRNHGSAQPAQRPARSRAGHSRPHPPAGRSDLRSATPEHGDHADAHQRDQPPRRARRRQRRLSKRPPRPGRRGRHRAARRRRRAGPGVQHLAQQRAR